MNIQGKYIVGIVLFLYCIKLSATEIVISNRFANEEIYNALLDSNPPAHADVHVHFSVRNSTAQTQQLYLSIINPTIDKIIIRDDSSTAVLGDLITFMHRKFKHINHVYPFVLQRGQIKTIDLTIAKQWQAVNFRVLLSTENAFIKTTNHDNFFIGIFFGAMFMYLLLLICFFIFSKSNFFLIYLAINFFMLLIFFQYSGTGFQFIWFYSATIQKYVTVIAAIGYLTAHISFVQTFFSVRFRNNFSVFMVRVFASILTLFGIIFFIQLYYRTYGYLHTDIFYYIISGLFVYGSTVIILCIYAYRESKRREIMWVMIGMLFHIANWMLFINNEFAMLRPLNLADNFKLFQSNIFIPQMNYFLTIFEMLIVSVFIAINYHNLIRQNNLSAKRLDFLQKRNINTFVLGQEAEREKISAEIGDVISKDISHLKSVLRKFNEKKHDEKTIPTVLKDIDTTLEDISNITGNYVAPDMQKMKLAELIVTATEKLFAEINTIYDFSKVPENMQLSAVANINLYRIMQEISNNILKHAKAENVTVIAIKDGKTLQIKISDDGIGFSVNTAGNQGIGLMNIESRMNSLNGNFYVLSNKKTGSSLHLIMSVKDIT